MLPGRHPPLINDRNDCFTKHEHPSRSISWKFQLEKKNFQSRSSGLFCATWFFRTFQGCYLYVQVTDLALKQKKKKREQHSKSTWDIQYAWTSIQDFDPTLKHSFENMALWLESRQISSRKANDWKDAHNNTTYFFKFSGKKVKNLKEVLD